MHKHRRIWRCLFVGKNSSYRQYTKKISETKDLYSILGVAPKATQVEIKQAYYHLTMKYHPDRNEDYPEAAIKFREITEAYEILGNSMTRERYDIGGISLAESTIPKARKQPIQHNVKYAQFFDKRNTKTHTKQRFTIGDATDQFPLKNELKKPFEYSTPEDNASHEKIKAFALIFFIGLMVYKGRYGS